MSAFRVVLVTAPEEKAESISRDIIENHLAACVNIVKDVSSFYLSRGKPENTRESLLIIKTATKKVEELIRFVRSVHDYEVPEVVSLTIAEGNPDYLNWLDRETAS